MSEIGSKEIGSEFWNVPVTEVRNNLFPAFTQWFLSGRSALKGIIKKLGSGKRVALPSWCCESIIKPFMDAEYDVHFYPVFFFGSKLIQEIDLNSDVLLVMDYFGYAGESPDLKNYKGIVIRDLTHAIFSEQRTDADYYFGSLRKWCGVWTGGFAWTRDGHSLPMGDEASEEYISLRTNAMEHKALYINGKKDDKGYLKQFDEAELSLDDIGVMGASERDIKLAHKLDVENMKTRRRANAEVLMRSFPEWLIFSKISSKDTPMFVPVIVPNGCRDELRKYLIKHEIYCPVHWPVSEYHKLEDQTVYLYDNELSLVCDQRYSEEDMNRVVATIKDFMEDQGWH